VRRGLGVRKREGNEKKKSMLSKSDMGKAVCGSSGREEVKVSYGIRT